VNDYPLYLSNPKRVYKVPQQDDRDISGRRANLGANYHRNFWRRAGEVGDVREVKREREEVKVQCVLRSLGFM
jgi:hypothetical protein